ncbi:hypothetical protein [Kangiella sp. M94]
MAKNRLFRSKSKIVFIVFIFLASCEIEHNINHPDTLELNNSSKAILNECKENWASEYSTRDSFLDSLGRMDDYSSYILLEVGNSDHVVYEAYFLGYKGKTVYPSSTKGVKQSLKADDANLVFIELLEDVKSESIGEVFWPTPCKLLTFKVDDKKGQVANFTIVSLGNYNGQPYTLTELDILILKMQQYFEKLMSSG